MNHTASGVLALVAAVALTALALQAAGPAKTFQYGQWSAMTPFKDKAGTSINYYLFTPKAAAEGKKLPLVVWLHGGVKANGIGGPEVVQDAFYKDEQQKDHPCYVLRPVAVQGENWVSPRGPGTASHKMPDQPSKSLAATVELMDKIIADKGIDTERLYVVGASMGGYGTWDMIERYPNRFAAAMPICGGGDPSKAQSLKHMAIWVTHGGSDAIVPPKGSREMFDALIKARGEQPVVKDDAKAIRKSSADDRLRYYEYKGGNHNSAWDNGLTEPDLVSWFFSKNLSGGAAASGPAASGPAASAPAKAGGKSSP